MVNGRDQCDDGDEEGHTECDKFETCHTTGLNLQRTQVQPEMKRRHRLSDSDCTIARKRRRLEAITPFSHRLDLTYMCALYRHVFNKSFCVDISSGMVTTQQDCAHCLKGRGMQGDMKDQGDLMMQKYMTTYGTLSCSSSSNYKVNAMIEELSQTSGASSLGMKEVPDEIRERNRVAFEAKDVRHVSCFLIHMFVMNGLMQMVSLDLVSGQLYMECKEMNHNIKELEEKEKTFTDTTLSRLLSSMKRNIMTRHRQEELVSVIKK